VNEKFVYQVGNNKKVVTELVVIDGHVTCISLHLCWGCFVLHCSLRSPLGIVPILKYCLLYM